MLRKRYPVSKPDKKRINFILKNIPKSSNLILDVACSEGFLHNILVDIFGKNRVIGIDIWTKGDQKAYDYGLQVNEPEIKQDLNKYPYPIKDNQFDTIIAGEIIEHIQNPTMFLKELNRILKPNGTIIITTPNALGIHHILENPSKAEYDRLFGHIHFFNETALRRLLKYTNFNFIKSDYITYSKYYPIFLIRKQLGGTNLMAVARKSSS